MRRITASIAVAACTAVAAAATVGVAIAAPPMGHPHQPKPPTTYYVSMGDSLSVGIQPDSHGNNQLTNQGYADQLYASLHQSQRGLVHVQLGCSGETTKTLINGGICHYRHATSQLAAATAFLRAHRGRISLITINIGANDVGGCYKFTPPSVDTACLTKNTKVALSNLRHILVSFRKAAGRGVHIIGMTYYDPELAAWLLGGSSKTFAINSVPLSRDFDSAMSHVYGNGHARVADVFASFETTNFTVIPTLLGPLPTNVTRICEWTWMCAPGPQGPNIHANKNGYAVIAQTFLAASRH